VSQQSIDREGRRSTKAQQRCDQKKSSSGVGGRRRRMASTAERSRSGPIPNRSSFFSSVLLPPQSVLGVPRRSARLRSSFFRHCRISERVVGNTDISTRFHETSVLPVTRDQSESRCYRFWQDLVTYNPVFSEPTRNELRDVLGVRSLESKVRFADEPPRTRVAGTSPHPSESEGYRRSTLTPSFFTVSAFSRLSLSADLLAKK
jgi:hypothetical protein